MPGVVARHRERTNGGLWVLPSLLIPLIVAAVAWTFHVASKGDEVAPNVRFAGIDISGLAAADAAAEVGVREEEFLDTPVTIDLGERQVDLTAREIGFEYLYGDTVSAVIDARHGTGPWTEFVSWASTPFETVTVHDRYALNVTTARQRLSGEDFVLAGPVEPSLATDDESQIHVVPGTIGVGIDVDQVIDELVHADVADGSVEVTAAHVDLPPSVADADARTVADDLNEKTKSGLLAVVGDQTARLTPDQVRRHLVSTVHDGELQVTIDVPGLQEELESVFPEPIDGLVPPELGVIDGNVVVERAGTPPTVCCSAASVQRAADRYLEEGSGFYLLQTRPSDDPALVAWADGSAVKEVVSTFTTRHPCCEGRVTNIHTMADFMQGKYLAPGETLSMNEYVGPRTREKGYVGAGAIRSGYMTEEIGGGVSQFITTLFNAAFYGGLDLDSYQSHSIYFSRYPFGREATLSIPNPDLVITNNTDYPVLIWPTYDDTSITVTLYSTKNVDVAELGQRVTYRNQCRHSEIDRQRTFSDGLVLIDTIVANYRPGDGLDCQGRPIPKS
jgi:VanW like protein